MTTKKELTKKIAELQAQVDTMPDDPSGYYKPEYRDGYYCVLNDGDIVKYRWNGNEWDLFRLSQGNCFRTEEEAQHHKKKLDVIGKIRLAAMDDIAANGEIDWGDDWGKYYLYCEVNEKKWLIASSIGTKRPTEIYFKTKAAAEKCIADLGSELDVLIGEG